jgi:hypothetical protein
VFAGEEVSVCVPAMSICPRIAPCSPAIVIGCAALPL